MNTYKLNADSPNQSLKSLLTLAADGGLAIRNKKGEIVALMWPCRTIAASTTTGCDSIAQNDGSYRNR